MLCSTLFHAQILNKFTAFIVVVYLEIKPAECKVQCVSGLKFLQSFFKTYSETQGGQTVLKLVGNPDNL